MLRDAYLYHDTGRNRLYHTYIAMRGSDTEHDHYYNHYNYYNYYNYYYDNYNNYYSSYWTYYNYNVSAYYDNVSLGNH